LSLTPKSYAMSSCSTKSIISSGRGFAAAAKDVEDKENKELYEGQYNLLRDLGDWDVPRDLVDWFDAHLDASPVIGNPKEAAVGP
jgi:hypothetical protein